MNIGIISDTHGCADRWQLAYKKYLQHADMILHAGDVMYHGPRNPILADYNPALLAERIKSCSMPVIFARGNCDSEVDEMVLELPVAAPYAFVYASGRRIIITHGHLVENDKAKDDMAARLQADVFISGHIHVNVLEKRNNTIFLNPGSPSLSKRQDGRSTIAIMSEKNIKIIDIDTDEVLMTYNL